ncbi:MAG: glycosyltransferase family 39 protein [Acidobacteriota bacterium]
MPARAKLIVFRALDLLASVCSIASVLLLVLPDIDVPVAGGFVRLAGPRNQFLVALWCVIAMRSLVPSKRPWIFSVADRIAASVGSGRATVLFLIAAGWLLSLVFYGRGAVIEGDGAYYYAFLRSSLMDRDLNFRNELGYYASQSDSVSDCEVNGATGLVSNPFSIGPAILWSPFFLIGHGYAWTTGAAVDGYSAPYEAAVILGTQVYAALGILLTMGVVRRVVGAHAPLWSVLGLWLASPLVEYFRFAASMSHAHSVFAVSLFLYLYVKVESDQRPRDWIALGIAGGLVFLVRWQDATFCLLPLVALFRGKRLRDAVADGYLYAGSFFLVALPQLMVFKVLYGGWVTVPQGSGFVGILPRYIWHVLFSTNHGLLTWHPVFVLCLGGLAWGAARRLRQHRLLLVGLLLQLYVNASITQWWAGHSFGARRFLGCFALFAVGIATTMNWRALQGRRGHAVIFALCVLNYALWQTWKSGLLPPEGLVSISEFVGAVLGGATSIGAKTAATIVGIGLLALGDGPTRQQGWRNEELQ